MPCSSIFWVGLDVHKDSITASTPPFPRLAVRKPAQVAATAVAREMVGFLWAVLRDIDLSQRQEVSAA